MSKLETLLQLTSKFIDYYVKRTDDANVDTQLDIINSLFQDMSKEEQDKYYNYLFNGIIPSDERFSSLLGGVLGMIAVPAVDAYYYGAPSFFRATGTVVLGFCGGAVMGGLERPKSSNEVQALRAKSAISCIDNKLNPEGARGFLFSVESKILNQYENNVRRRRR